MSIRSSRQTFAFSMVAFISSLNGLAYAAAVEVPVNKAWTKTGVTLSAGQGVKIDATGVAELSSKSDPREFYHQVPPEGRTELHYGKPQPLMPALVLLGRFGDNGPVFLVGKSMMVWAGGPYGVGELQLGPNDEILDDNSGAWTAQITVLNSNTENGAIRDIGRGVTTYRDRTGQSILCEVTGINSGSLWGTDIYTDDSDVGAVAVHAGLLAVGERGIIKVTIIGPQEKYAGTARNGVSSNDYGKWEGSYRVELVRSLSK